MEQRCEEHAEKRAHASKLLGLRGTIFRSFMTPTNQKPDGMRWKDYFVQLTETEELEAPAIFLSHELSVEDAAMNVGVFMASLKKRVASATTSLHHWTQRKGRKDAAMEKKNTKLKRQVENMLADPEIREEKHSRQKQLVCLQFVGHRFV